MPVAKNVTYSSATATVELLRHTTRWTSNGAAADNNIVMPAGSYPGQRSHHKFAERVNASDKISFSPMTFIKGASALKLQAVNDEVLLEWTGAQWQVIYFAGTVLITGAPTNFGTQGAPAAKTTSATLTAPELLAGILTSNQGAAGAANYTLPLATDLDLALPGALAGDSFDFTLINISAVDAEDATILTNTGWTLVGRMLVESTGGTPAFASSGTFRARKTGVGAWTLYRIT